MSEITEIDLEKVTKAIKKAEKFGIGDSIVIVDEEENEDNKNLEYIENQIKAIQPQVRYVDGKPYMVNAEGELAPLNRAARRVMESQRRRGHLAKSENTLEIKK
jgi:hypothetical protein